MDTLTIPNINEMSPNEFEQFLDECESDLQNNVFLDFDEVFEELDKRYSAYE